MSKNVTIIDYGCGNLWSLKSSLNYLNISCKVSSDPNIIASSEILILPGVGSFPKAMNEIKKNEIDKAIKFATYKGKKILGICLGMQIMSIQSPEIEITNGLGLIDASVESLKIKDSSQNKVPHIGFNKVLSQPKSRLFNNLKKNSDFYFVHSFCIYKENLNGISAFCNYEKNFLAAYENENIFAVQFHPEKSQTNGLLLLNNFFNCKV